MDNLNDNNYMIRTGLENAGYSDIRYDEGSKNLTAVKNGQAYGFNTSGLTNKDGSLVGTQSQINSIISNPLTQARNYGINNGMAVGADRYNNPMYNGQTLSTAGMALINGNWYAPENQLKNNVAGIKPKEYENPYAETQSKLLEDLLNYRDFSYNPDDDKDLQNAMELARRQSMRDAVNRGQGNSFGMNYAASQAANSLIPQYRQQARQEYEADRGYLADLYGLTSDAERNARETYQMNRGFANDDREYASNQEYRQSQLANDDRDYYEGKRQFDLNFDEGRRQFNANLAETIRQFDKSMDLEEREFKEKYLLAWAEHHLNGMGYISEQQAREFSEAMELWIRNGSVPNEWAANVLGLPVGTTTLDAAQTYANIGYTNAKAANVGVTNKKSSGGGGKDDSGGGPTSLEEIYNMT